MKTPGSVTLIVEKLRSSRREDYERAAQEIWERYSEALLGLARRHLSSKVRRREDEEDVLQSMYKSFCIRHRRGDFDLEDRHDLWRLLVAITENKARNVAIKHMRAKRLVTRDQAEGATGGDSGESQSYLAAIRDPKPGPEEAAVLVEALRRRLEVLPEPLREIALWKLEGRTNEEIAGKLRCVVRSVERKLAIIRKQWEAMDSAG